MAIFYGYPSSLSAIAGAVAALCSTHTAWAQTPPSAPAASGADSTTLQKVVVQSRNARSLIEQKRNEVSATSAISAAEIARRPVANVVDAVSVLPGISAYADMGLGQAATGNPEFITIRGIDSSYNVYLLNGVRVPQSDPNSRALSLKLLPPFGIQSIKIVKSPTADYQGDSIGGVVDIHTPTAFDYSAPLTKFTLQGADAALADKRGFTGKGGAAQVEFARRLAGDTIGIYATAYYQNTHSVGNAGEVGGYSATLQSQSQLTDYSKVDSLTANQYKYDFYTNDIESYGGNVSLDYHDGKQTLYARLTAAEYDDKGVDSQMSIRHQLANTGRNAAGQVVDYWGRGVGPGLPGDAAYAPQQTSQNPGGGSYNAAGVYDPNGILPGHYFQLRDQKDLLSTVQLGGTTAMEHLALSYGGSYGFARQARPNYVEASSYGLPMESGRYNIELVDGYRPDITFNTPEAKAYMYNQASNALWKFQGSNSASDDKMYAAHVDADYKVADSAWTVVSSGLDVSRSERSQYAHQFTGGGGDNLAILTPQGYAAPYFNPAGPTVDQLAGRNVTGGFLGDPGAFRAFDRSTYVNGLLPHAYQDSYAIDPKTGLKTWNNPGAYTANDYNQGTVSGTENIYAAYVSATWALGNLSVYPGIRYEYTKYGATFWAADGGSGSFQKLGSNYGVVSPSVNAVYRTEDDFVYRGSVRQGFSRPAFGLLAGPASFSRDGVSGAITGITEGNPNLKPTKSINYDVSAEYYGWKGGVMEVAAYYKNLSKFIYAASVTGGGVDAQSGSESVGSVTVTQPQNGNGGQLAGVELNARQQLAWLPGAYRGIGVGANLTWQHSAADSGRADHAGRLTWLPRAPQVIYNLEAYYDLQGARASLTYQYTGLQLINLTSNGLDNYLQPTRFLNLSLGYSVAGIDLTFGARNLTNAPVFWKTLGKSTRYLGTQDGGGNGSYVETGRVYTLTGSYAF